MAKEKEVKVSGDKKGSKLAVRRAIEVSQGLLYSLTYKDDKEVVEPIKIGVKTIRTSISNDEKANKEHNFKSSNIQTIQYAKLKNDSSILRVKLNIKFTDFLKIESIDREEDGFLKKYKNILAENDKLADQAKDAIAHAFAFRVISGDLLWRNKENSFSIKVKMETKVKNGKDVIKDHLEFNDSELMSHMVFNYDNGSLAYNKPMFDNLEHYEKLKKLIKAALFDDKESLSLKIEYTVDKGLEGAEIYPSQLMNDENAGPKDIKKFLLETEGVAAMSTQKIQNALRTFDHFYTKDYGSIKKELAIEPYGIDLNAEEAYRKDNGIDFYTYKANIIKDTTSLTLEEMIYLTAIFIRGGVFNRSSVKAKG